jgi:hypothetical protein
VYNRRIRHRLRRGFSLGIVIWFRRAKRPVSRALPLIPGATPSIELSTPQLGEYERIFCVGDLSSRSDKYAWRLLSVEVFKSAVGVRFELRGEEAGKRWTEWIQEIDVAGQEGPLVRIGSGTGSFFSPASEALIVHTWFKRPVDQPTRELALRVDTSRVPLARYLS